MRARWWAVAVVVGVAFGLSGTVGAHAASYAQPPVQSPLGPWGELLGCALLLLAALLLAVISAAIRRIERRMKGK